MAEKIFIGGAPTLAQVHTETPGGTIAETDIFYVKLEDRHGNDHGLPLPMSCSL